MVIVGFKENKSCSDGMELVVKKPAATETICANSPVPVAYSVQTITSSLDCNDASSNPLTNALVITRSAQEVGSETRSSSIPELTVRVSRESTPEKTPVEARAEKLNSEAKLENAASRGEIMVGMTMTQVVKAWGPPHSDEGNSTMSGYGTTSLWEYYRKGQTVSLSFKDGILIRWTWDH